MIRNSTLESTLIFLFLFTQIVGLSIIGILIPPLGSLAGSLKYLVFLLPIIYLVKGVYIELRMLIVILIFITTILINNVDPIFSSHSRLVSWILLIFAVGPFIYNEYLYNFRVKLLNIFLFTFMLIGFLSFLWWILGLPHYGRGHFTGLMSHSMLLAPVAAIGSIYAITKWYSSYDNNRLKIFYLLMFTSNFISILLAASRGALAGAFMALIIFVLFSKIKYKKFIVIFSLLSWFISAQFVSVNLANSSITEEMVNRGIENTREGLWHDRIMEFNSSPFFGVGFVAQDLTLDDRRGKDAGENGKIEPGSTYLMILSMTGILGAVSLLVLFSKYLSRINNLKNNLTKPEVLIFIFFGVHFISEGYIFSSGALLAFLFWLLIGVTYPTTYNQTKIGNSFES